ncbi:hypothetical protein EMIT0P2_90157 [Pseudomonas sp. IT-P2]
MAANPTAKIGNRFVRFTQMIFAPSVLIPREADR